MYEWERQIQVMVDEIDECLNSHSDGEPTLRGLARKLGYSEFHATRKVQGDYRHVLPGLSEGTETGLCAERGAGQSRRRCLRSKFRKGNTWFLSTVPFSTNRKTAVWRKG